MKKILEFLQTLFLKFQEYFFTTVHLLVAFSLLYGLFYIRLLPRTSRDLWQNLTHYQLFLILLTLTCILLNIYNTFKLLGFIKQKERSTWTTVYLYPLEQLDDYIIAILKNLYNFFWFSLEKIVEKVYGRICVHYLALLPLVKSFTNPKHSPYYFKFLLALKLLPRIIFVSVLTYDVFFCQRFDYTFRCIPFLLITLLEPIFLFILKDFHETHVYNLGSFLDKKTIPDTDIEICVPREKDEKWPYGAKDFDDFYDNHFYPVADIAETIKKYETWRAEKMPTYYIQLSLQALRLSVYIYVLFYGII